MEPLTVLTSAALKQAITHLTKKLIDKAWDIGENQGKNILGQLSEDYPATIYTERYVNRFLKMRTLHSAESDVYLNEIYSPLRIVKQGGSEEFIVGDTFTLNFNRTVNIIGIAGQGKSTILRKLFLEEIYKAERFPFFIELRKIEESSILDYLKQQLEDISLSLIEGDVEILLQSRKVVLMLDGFDEVISSRRHRLLNEINQLKTRYNCSVIVTSRPGTEICTEIDIINFKVKTLNCNEIISIILKLEKNAVNEELKDLIIHNLQLQGTLVSPILVNLLYVCYPYLDIVPKNVIDFYDKLFITLFSRHDKIKNFNRERSSQVSSIEAGNIFNAFCFDSLNKNVMEFTEESLYKFLNSALKLNGTSLELTEKVQNDLIDITCLIQKDGFDKYLFLHKSIQEFHAAKFIASLPHVHKEKFYLKLLEVIDEEDKFDNVLQFLKEIDTNDYNALLVLKYFQNKKLNRLNTESKDTILGNIVSEILKTRVIEFEIKDGEYEVASLESITSNNLLSTINLFNNGVRGAVLASEHLLDNHFFKRQKTTFNINLLTAAELEKISRKSKKQGKSSGIAKLSIFDYLKFSKGYDSFETALKSEIITFVTDIYSPIEEKNRMVARVLDIDFNI
ncbi:NACHT domain-containing protein [Pseudoalteromonas sp. NZS127]|uniref:NACHT domain-containing protein n=1 Tax=Pseudoalteromonas TaxID=53246 RepID=UPI0018CE803A|nr:NACHT domain-containing protein [Pseudoalteromonas sp. NZS127]